jgi:hypothetical protein
MTLTIEVPQEVEGRLLEKAKQRGLALPEYVLQLLSTEANVSPPAHFPDSAARQAEIRALATAPAAARESALRASANAAATYYQTEAGREELEDWRALDGGEFRDD